MAKKPEDYFSDLAKVKPSPSGFAPIVKRPRKAGFPKGLVLLVLGCATIFGFVKYFSAHSPAQAIATVTHALPANEKGVVEQLLKKYPGLLKKQDMQALVSAAQAQVARQPAAQAQLKGKTPGKTAPSRAVQSPYVFIDGKMYKRSPDNVYYVNGHRLYYVSNH